MGKTGKKNKNKEWILWRNKMHEKGSMSVQKEDWRAWRKKMQEKGSIPTQEEDNPDQKENSEEQRDTSPDPKKNDEEQRDTSPDQKKNDEEQRDTSPSETSNPSSPKQPIGVEKGAEAASSSAKTTPTNLAASSSASILGPGPKSIASSSISLLGPGPRPGPGLVARQKPQHPPKPQLPPKPKLFEGKAEVITRLLSETPDVDGLELLLNATGIRVTTEIVEDVLKASYKAGAGALKFFHWSAQQLGSRHSPYAWNLLVDILGNNKMFDAMWDAVKSMKAEGILSRQTFASVFTCYAMANKSNEAIMTFEVMENYGCTQDVSAFNCLLCALCRYMQTPKAVEFCKKMEGQFPPDADTYAILLEGWEKQNNAAKAKKTFGEMIMQLGWDPHNTAAYNAFLGTLCKCGQVDEALKFLHVMRSRNCFPDKSFYISAVNSLSLQNRLHEAAMVFETMLQCGHIPSTTAYNSMISTYCYAGRIDDAYRLLDGMVFNGAFPDPVTYNTIFQALIKARKMEEAASMFREMTRNEFDPDSDSYTMALVVKNLKIASMIWEHMSEKGIFPSMEFVTTFIDTLCENGKRAEAQKYVDEMKNQGIRVSEEILRKVKAPHFESVRTDTAEQSSKKRKKVKAPHFESVRKDTAERSSKKWKEQQRSGKDSNVIVIKLLDNSSD